MFFSAHGFNKRGSWANKVILCLLSAQNCIPAALAEPAATALPEQATNFSEAGHVTVITNNATMDINHHVDNTVLNWNSFNVGRDATVNFNQTSTTSLTVNRIHDLSASQIFGQLNANGKVWLVNQNGIVFGAGAQVNVAEGVFTTLDVAQDAIETGITAPFTNREAAFKLFTDENGNVLPSEIITIADGAEINGDRIIVIAPDIENNGLIQTPDGQTILAAGHKVYITGSEDINLRGLLVEVDGGLIDENGNATPNGSGETTTVTNLGDIVAERGNVTLVGMAVNQNGRTSATTSVNANGSIHLLARDGVSIVDDANTATGLRMQATRTGKVTFGENSITRIEAELNSSDTAIDAQAQLPSEVIVSGQKIHLQENSLIEAKGGIVQLQAEINPENTDDTFGGTTAIRENVSAVIQMEAGSRIDVSGNDVTLDMSRNNLAVELRGNELKDLPVQKDGEIRSQEVIIDLRNIDDADDFEMGDIEAALNGVQKGVAERTSEGGTVSLISEGEVRLLDGSEIDVSGGKVTYNSGDIRYTELDFNGQTVNIHDADPNRIYDGIAGTVTLENQPGFIEGRGAGTVHIAANGIIADAALTGKVDIGRYQRTESAMPQAGRLIIGFRDGEALYTDSTDPGTVFNSVDLLYTGKSSSDSTITISSANTSRRAPNVTLQDENFSEYTGIDSLSIDESIAEVLSAELQPAISNAIDSAVQDGIDTGSLVNDDVHVADTAQKFSDELGEKFADQLLLSTDFLTEGGFSRAEIYSNGNIDIVDGAALNLAANTQLTLHGNSVNVNRDIISPAGDISINTISTQLPVRVDANNNVLSGMLTTYRNSISRASTSEQSTFLGLNTEGNADNFLKLQITNGSGDLAFSADINSGASANVAPGQTNATGIYINDGVKIDVSGDWTNDIAKIAGTNNPRKPITLDGGTIELTSNLNNDTVELGEGSSLITMGGAYVNASRKLTNGDGGDISIILNEETSDLVMAGNNRFQGHAPGEGGSFTLQISGDISIQQQDEQITVAGQTTRIDDAFFSQSGFSDFDITTSLGDISIQPGANIQLKTSSLFLPSNIFDRSSSSMQKLLTASSSASVLGFKQGSVNGFTNSGFLGYKPDYLRTGQQLNLEISAEDFPTTASRTDFIFSDGASIYADADSSISLTNNGGGFMAIYGDINAKGADVNLQLQRQSFQDFSAAHALIIGDTASIDVSSKAISIPDPKNGLNQGYVTDAGNIDISSSGILLVQEGSSIDASGDNRVFEFLTGIQEEVFSVKNVYGDAGSIELFANEFIVMNGDLDVSAANVNGAFGGAITIAVDGNISIDTEVLTNPSFDGLNPDIIVSQSTNSPGVTPSFEAGEDVIQAIMDNTGLSYDDINNKTYVSADELMASGADSVKFTTNGSFNFQDSVTLNMKRDIEIDTTVINSIVTPDPLAAPGAPGAATIDLNANFVSLGSNETSNLASDINDNVSLNINANAIQLKGNTVLKNINHVNLDSNGDILLRGADGELSGEFRMMGDLELTADRIYPATMTDFTIDVGNSANAEENPNVVTINPGGDYGLTLSAAGSLTIEGDVIEQGGTLLAPEGEINLLASKSVTFLEDSLTSVSANGLSIFLGQTETNVNGTQWVYTTSDGKNIVYGDGENNQNSPQKSISILADSIDIQEGAEIDISGGGDILTYQFVPGPGGSNDFGLAENAGNYFAIIPALDSDFAPFDASEFDGWNLDAGQSVYLAGGNGLDEGEYVMLPARYALLPGAYLVESVDGYDNIPLNQSVSDFAGGTLVAGRYTIGSTDLQQSNTQGFVVRSGSFANKLSELDIQSSNDVVTELAGSFDQALPRLTQDAGRLTLQASSAMNLDGSLVTAVEVGARGAQIDIASNVLRIVNNKDGLGGVELLAENLNNLGAESLFLGGQRTETKDAVVFDVISDNVTLESGAELEGPEVILAASDNLILQSGSSLTGSGDINSSEQTYDMGSQHSAIARVSANKQVSIQRDNVLTGTAPNLIVEQGAILTADTSVTLDSSGNLQSFGTVNSPSQLLGAGLISIGDIDGSLGLGGLVINLQDLENIKGQDLVLRTSGQIDLYGDATIDVQSLEVNATGFVANQASNADVTIMANEISIGNDTGDSLGDLGIATPNGLLTIEANSLTLNSGDFSLNGFSNVTANVTGDVIGSGETTLNVYNGNLNLNTSRLTALTGADIALNAVSGALSLGLIEGFEPDTTTRGIGARLRLQGESVSVDTNIDMPVGQIQMTSPGDITLGQNADIQAEGYSINVVDVDTIVYDAGKVNITSTAGNINLQEGSRIDVSASEDGGTAGDVELIARSGDVSVSGELVANSESPETGGRILVDANTLGVETADPGSNQFSQLNTVLEQGNFSRDRELQLGQGNIVVDASDVVSAQRIKLVANDTTTNNGSITVAGKLQTVGETEGGQIELVAQNDLTIASSAELSVAATSTDSSVNADAGKVFLQATEGSLAVQNGAEIDIAGHQQGADGELHMRVRRNSPTSIAVSEFNPVISGNGDIIFEGVQVYNNQGTVDGSFVGFTDAVTFMNNGDTIKNSLGVSGDNVHVRAGVEIRNDGDITVSDTVDLSMWRSNDDEVGYLTIRSSGDLFVNADIKDGIGETRIPGAETCTIFGCTQEPDIVTSTILDGDAWGINLVAGAEVNNGQFSADIFRTNLDNQGSVILAADTIIRTSTADINIAAANNLALTNVNSLIYTMGERSGFELDAEANGLEAAKYLPENGGSINITVGNDIVGAASDKTQLFNQWFNKQEAIEEISNIFGTIPGENAGTWIDIDGFAQGIAAFGGGDIAIQAGNDIKDISVSAPTNVLFDGETEQEVRIGEGDIHIAAGGDIEGGIFFVGDGDATITADGDITAGRENGNNELNAVVAVMGGTVDMIARGDVNIDAIYNPTTVQYGVATTGNNNVNAARQTPVFVSYTDDTSVSVRSIKGDLNYNSSGGDAAALVEGSETGTSSKFNQLTSSFGYLPGDVHLSAAGNIAFDSGFLRLMSDSESSLEIFAGDSIRFGQTGSVSIEQSDTSSSLIASIDNITTTLSDLQDITAFNLAAAQPIHINDENPSYIVAQEGNIDGGRIGLRENARVFAGNDINEITFKGQNNRLTDVTVVEAGRDIILTGGTDVINLSGPGRLEVIAGRDIDLGQSDGIETAGNLTNPNLPDVGADILVQAGAGNGAEYESFYAEYFLSDSAEYNDVLNTFLQDKFASDTELTAFLAQSASQQWQQIGEEFKPEILNAFYSELKETGRDTQNDFSRGYRAIDILFPESQFNREDAYEPSKLALIEPGESKEDYFNRLVGLSDYQGELRLFASKIYSLDGGNVDIMSPGGLVNAGLNTNPDPGALIGVVAQSFGSIRSFSRDDFQVNQSRVSTLLGGDIIMWSSLGDIDAGRGSKAAVSAPEPRVTIDAQGNIKVDISNTVSGSGIRAVVIDPSVEPGDIDLIAPNGVIDAGDAGIAGSGNLFVAAEAIIGADNLAIGGLTVGVSTGAASGGNISTAGLGGGDVAAAATQAAQSAAADSADTAPEPEETAEEQLTYLSVDIIGYGEEGADADDA